MNTGIGDAANLAWKLKAVLDVRAPDALLDSFEAERIGFARRLVQTTDRAFSLASAEGGLADVVRLWIAPLIIPAAFMSEAVREFAFRTVSQIGVDYRGGPLSEGKAGAVHGGDRLPWVAAQGHDNHAPLKAARWQIHVYGAELPEVAAWGERRSVPIHVLPWTPRHGEAGLARAAVYLIRPDAYVALADASGAPDAAERFFVRRGPSP
jgi:FAD binding domain